MKFFVAFVALVAVAVANPVHKPVMADAELETIIAAIQSPNTHPATAQLLEEMLADILGATDNISVGPAMIDPLDNIAIGPAMIETPLPEGALTPTPIVPSPVVVGPIPEGSPAPLVQIIVNVNQASGAAPSPAGVPELGADPVIVVDNAPVDPVNVVDAAVPETIDPIQVIETAPAPIEPVSVVNPIIPSPAVILPEELN